MGSVTNYPSPALLTEISGPWNVSFDQKMRGPVNPVVMPRLQPWNEMPNDSVKYYSGTAVYTTGSRSGQTSGERTDIARSG
ncbi:MAG: hypothetical protein ACLR8Y_04395 [Alistipes indistinctus]